MTATEERELVCVLCGTPWPEYSNVCGNSECNGFCTWGPFKGADPSSWIRTDEGWALRPAPAREDDDS